MGKKNRQIRFRILHRLLLIVLALGVTVSVVWYISPRLNQMEAPPEPAAPRERTFVWGDIVDTSKEAYSYEEMEEDLALLAERYPNLLSVKSAGKSLDGREIYYADFGTWNARYHVMVNAGIHGREYLTPLFVMKQLEYYLANYYTENEEGVAFADVMGTWSFRIVPMINPDGIMLSQKGLSAIRSEELRQGIEEIYRSDCELYESYRKYRSIDEYLPYWKANAAGVDLNRNFGIDGWKQVKTGINLPSAQKYKGSSENSEPETMAMVELTKQMKNLVCSVSVHSQGELIYWDCGQTGEVRASTGKLAELAQSLNGYRLYDDFTAPDATYNDWCVLQLGVPSVNIETGTGKCPLPISQLDSIWNKNFLLWFEIAKQMKP